MTAFLIVVWVVCGLGGGWACGWFIQTRQWLLAAIGLGVMVVGIAAGLAVSS